MPPVFQIKDLACCYNNGRTVLSVPRLEVKAGKILFLVGPSGIGKSTFIEALGLMNNTIRNSEATSVLFFDHKTSRSTELKSLWLEGDDDEISTFRNRHFSFIFQQTNLMPNFSAGENMCISQLIRGIPLSEAKKTVLQAMTDLKLPASVFDKKTTQLSGGQRQRVAFVRAITADFQVLFGDEPTGNLDKDTAFRLMTILRDNLKRHNRTAIIVSHDIDLALAFADQIAILFKQQDNPDVGDNSEQHGVLKDSLILAKREYDWVTSTGSVLNAPSEFIQEHLN